MEKQLPDVIYGHYAEAGTRDEYLRTDVLAAALVDSGQTLRVGVYKLVGYADVTNATTVKRLPGEKTL